MVLLGNLFSTFETTFWLRITDEGSVPEFAHMVHIVNFIRLKMAYTS